jgi:hypothetical protein
MSVITAQFLTMERDHLFDLTRRLFAAVNPDVLRDAQSPLTVGVNGMLSTGKKIISDAALDVFMDAENRVMEGKAGYDEYWTGTRAGAAVEIDYIDMAYPYRAEYSPRVGPPTPQCGRFPSRPAGDDRQEKMKVFMGWRQHGGVTFLQNAHDDMPDTGMSIFIERPRGSLVNYSGARHVDTPLALRDMFRSVGEKAPWVRFVEVNVRDERLLADENFMRNLTVFGPFCRLDKTAPAPSALAQPYRTTVNVYGRNFPQPL